MKRSLLTIIAFVFYFAGAYSAVAQQEVYYTPPDDNRMQLISQELDKTEEVRVVAKVKYIPRIVPHRNTLDFSSEIYSAKFDEPKSFSQKAFMAGYNIKYAHRTSTDPNSVINMYGLQAQWANGKFKQPPGVGPSGIKDYTFDFRGIIGKDLYPTRQVRLTPYAGYGYRYLKDNSEGLDALVDGFTLLGYRRYSHYNYIPLGLDMVYQTMPVYSIEGNLEWDYMFDGWQVSKLGVLPGYDTLVVQQGGGYGLRASLRYNIYLKSCTAFAEAFYRYWKIAKSNSKDDPTDPTVQLDEPRNHTEEFGLRLGVEL